MGGWGNRDRRKGLACYGGGFSTHGRGEERAEGGGFLGKLGDESPRDEGVQGG